MNVLAAGLRLDMDGGDYFVLALYFLVVLGIGFAARRSVSSSLDFFLSGRSLPAWVTGLAFVSANLGAIELLGMAANGAQYGLPTLHYYWVGAIPAMVFLGLVMMPFYYGAKVRSVPEYLRLRFNKPTHLFNALTFAFASVLIAGVNLFALALIMQSLLGWSLSLSIVVAAFIVLAYTTLGGLTAAVYNEVLQFFVIVAVPRPAERGGAGQDRRLGRAHAEGVGLQARRPGAERLAGHVGRQRDRRVRQLDRDRLRPRLRALVRLLDDELRRGPARAVGEEHERRAADADHRRVPEDADPVRDHRPGPDRVPGHPRARRRAATSSTTTRSR